MILNRARGLSVKDKLEIINYLEEFLWEERISWCELIKSTEYQKIRPFFDKRTRKILESDNESGKALNGKNAIKKTLLRAELNMIKAKWHIS
jgi:hypothetical protein